MVKQTHGCTVLTNYHSMDKSWYSNLGNKNFCYDLK